jgi:hypothetical protein
MVITSVKQTGIINEFLVRVGNVNNPAQAETAFNALRKRLIDNGKQHHAEVPIADLVSIKPETDGSMFVRIECKDGTGFLVKEFYYKDNKLQLFW